MAGKLKDFLGRIFQYARNWRVHGRGRERLYVTKGLCLALLVIAICDLLTGAFRGGLVLLAVGAFFLIQTQIRIARTRH